MRLESQVLTWNDARTDNARTPKRHFAWRPDSVMGWELHGNPDLHLRSIHNETLKCVYTSLKKAITILDAPQSCLLVSPAEFACSSPYVDTHYMYWQDFVWPQHIVSKSIVKTANLGYWSIVTVKKTILIALMPEDLWIDPAYQQLKGKGLFAEKNSPKSIQPKIY